MLDMSFAQRQDLYNLFTIYISSAALLLYNLTHFREKRVIPSTVSQAVLRCSGDDTHGYRRLAGVLTVMEIVLISLFQHGLVAVLNTILGEVLGTGTNYFGMIFCMPFLLAVYCWLLGINPFQQIDLITPAYPLALFFMKIGCFCVGCCRGIVCEFGMYNYGSGDIEFPIQVVEAVVALILFLFFHFCRKKAQPGTLLPMYVVAYCTIRFFSEFFRKEPPFFGLLKVYHILCLLGILLGCLQLYFLTKYRNRVISLFDNNLPAYLCRKKASRHIVS